MPAAMVVSIYGSQCRKSYEDKTACARFSNDQTTFYRRIFQYLPRFQHIHFYTFIFHQNVNCEYIMRTSGSVMCSCYDLSISFFFLFLNSSIDLADCIVDVFNRVFNRVFNFLFCINRATAAAVATVARWACSRSILQMVISTRGQHRFLLTHTRKCTHIHDAWCYKCAL